METPRISREDLELELSPEEGEALVKLKQALDNLDLDLKWFKNDMMLVRFLRARNLDFKKTQQMITHCIEVRKEWDIDSFETWDPPENISSGFDLYLCGFDFENRPVYYAPLGNWASARDLFDQGQREDLLRFAVKSMNFVHDTLLTTKHQNFVAIVDITGATYGKGLHEIQNFKGIQDLIWLFREYEATFPETLHEAYIINTPTVFYWGYNIVRPLLSKRTLSKIHIYETSNISWQSDLRKTVPETSIPKKLGGLGEMKSFY